MAFTIGTVPPWAHAVKYAFVTSETTDGSIDETGSAPGIASANAICTRLANSAGSIIPVPNQAGPWRAWLSDARSSPLDDIYTGNGRLPPTRRQRPDCGKLVRVNKRDAPSPPQHGRTRHPPTTGCLDGQPEYLNPGQYHMWRLDRRDVGLRPTRNVRPPPRPRSLDGRQESACVMQLTSVRFPAGGSPSGTESLHGRVKRGSTPTHPTQGKSADGALLVDGTFLLQMEPLSPSPAPTHRNQRCTYSPSREESIGSSGSCS